MSRLSLTVAAAAACVGAASAFTAPAALPALRTSAASASASRQAPTLLRRPAARSMLRMAEGEEAPKNEMNPWLSLNTRGGAMVWTGVFLVLPFFIYGPLSELAGDELVAGRWIGAFYCLFGLIAWTSSYVFRVGTKDMTYTKQLKQYEDAVIAKRFEELQADEVNVLLNDLENEDDSKDGKQPPKIRGSGWRPDQY